MNIERIKAVMAERGISQTELARQVGATQGAINQILSGRSATSKLLPAIARALGVALEYLEGLTDNPDPTGPNMSEEEMQEELGVTRIISLEIGYAMGAGSYIDEHADSTFVNFDTQWLGGITGSPPSMLFVASGVGDSMMPTLLDSDTMIVDRAKRRIDQQDRVWALSYGELGMIKRVRRLPSGRFLIISDNPAIENFEAVEDELHVIGRIVWVGRKI